MIKYNLVKHCRWCKKRFVVEKEQKRTIYCASCQKKLESGKKSDKVEE